MNFGHLPACLALRTISTPTRSPGGTPSASLTEVHAARTRASRRKDPSDDGCTQKWGGVGEPLDGSGRIVRVPRTNYSFHGVVGVTQDVPLIEPFWTHTWTTAVLSVRLHQKNTFPSGTASVAILAQNAVRMEDEPSVVYVDTVALATATVTSALAAGALLTANISGNIGPMLRLLMRVNQGMTAGVIELAVSVDLVGRP